LAQAIKTWETNARKYAPIYTEPGFLNQLGIAETNTWYYDGARALYDLADYFQEESFLALGHNVATFYRDKIVLPNQGAIPGRRNFTEGLRRHFHKTGDLQSKNAVDLLSTRAAYASPTAGLSYLIPYDVQREVAFALMAALDREMVGLSPHPRKEVYRDLLLGYLQNQVRTKIYPYLQPFMMALAGEALIRYDAVFPGDARILWALIDFAEFLTSGPAWCPLNQSWFYESFKEGTTPPDPLLYPVKGAPDLNLLIAPVLGWIYQKTQEPAYLRRAREAFIGGVNGAWLGEGKQAKQWVQNYRWSTRLVQLFKSLRTR
jgi:hypothetical protein